MVICVLVFTLPFALPFSVSNGFFIIAEAAAALHPRVSNKVVMAGNGPNGSVYAAVPMESYNVDIENKAVEEAHLENTTVHNFSWEGITVTVKDRQTKQPKAILDGISGVVRAGKVRS
jgi:NAD(P)H-hydrate repair Nnr-like enzyme with NAD(P)H-hydrate epimerase domain